MSQYHEDANMNLHSVRGNILDNEYQCQAICHGVNTQGVLGAGLARQIVSDPRYSGLQAAFAARCRGEHRLQPGEVFTWQAPDGLLILNLATQEYYGRRGHATYAWVEQALTSLRQELHHRLSVTHLAMPRIASGLGGLDYLQVRPLILTALGTWPGDLFLYE